METKKYLVFDSTMRDGEQQPMLSFRDDEKIGLCYQLEKLGIFEIDLMPSIDEHERILIRLLNDTRLRNRLGSSTMVHRKYIDQAVDVNCRVAYLFVHVSDGLMKARGKTREQNLADISDCVDYALSKGLVVDFCGGDGTRGDPGYLKELLTEIGTKIRFYQPCDTSGLMTPETLRDKYGVIIDGINYDEIDNTVQMVTNMCRGVQAPSVNLDRKYPNISGIH